MVEHGAAAGDQTLTVTHSTRGVMTVLLNRPERGNALSQQMMAELAGVLERAATDNRIRVVVLRGAGRNFCSGADLSEQGTKGQDRIALPDLLRSVDNLPKPTIAVVHGGGIGGGLALAASCDVVLATDTAFFSVPELRVGLVPSGLLPFFVQALGYRGFRRYGLSGERIGADLAVRLGLASAVLRDDQIEPEIDTLVDSLLHSAPGALAQLKQRLAAYAAPPAGLADEVAADSPSRAAEFREGVASFREKRKPAWYNPG